MSIDFTALTQAEQRQVAERLLKIRDSGWKPFWCPDPKCSGDPHWLEDANVDYTFEPEYAVAGPNGEPLGEVFTDADGMVWGRPVLDPKWAHNHAREDQRLPYWGKPWTLFIMSGRGSGKTTTGTEFVTLCARKGLDGAILGRRGTELVNTHVATIIARAHPDFVPIHWASKDILEWPNGAITYLFSAEKPENIRSVNLSYAWVDEASFMDEIKTAWMNLRLATRNKVKGNPIHFLITSTPTPTEWTMKMEDDPAVEVRRVSTYANKNNLDADYLEMLEHEFEGTRMGRQELHGEVLRDVVGALWNDGLFKHQHCDTMQEFDDLCEAMDARVVAVDPAGSKGPRSDATGIIGVGAMHFDDDGNRMKRSLVSVLARATIKGTPTEWAAQAYKCAHIINADFIVAEKNFGGDMVKQVLVDYANTHPEDMNIYNEDGEVFTVQVEHAQKSKETRAEATVAKYEQGTVTHVTSPHVFGDLSELEKQQCVWVPKSRGGKDPSPNDVDALVWAVRAVDTKVKYEAQAASGKDVLAMMRQMGRRSA